MKVGQVANEPGVEHILEGSVRKSGNRVRITAQLISATDGFHLWSERYDRELVDIFAVQDEISASIAAVLKTRLMARPDIGKAYTPNVAAYEAYLKALHYKWKHTSPESLQKSRECYEEAARLDSRFALPYAGRAEYHHIISSFLTDPREGATLGRQAAQKALELDPSLPEAHAWLGIFAVWVDLTGSRPNGGLIWHFHGSQSRRTCGICMGISISVRWESTGSGGSAPAPA